VLMVWGERQTCREGAGPANQRETPCLHDLVDTQRHQ
jgi:hypothetical protein